MWNWIHRWQQRQRDLQQGVDADLVQSNRRRWKLCACLFGLAFASFGLQASVKFTGFLNQIAVGITMLLFVAAMLMCNWARAWGEFLDRADPKEAPKLWKWRR